MDTERRTVTAEPLIMDALALAIKLRKLADKRGWTNREITLRLGLSQTAETRVSTWLSGKRLPSLQTLERLAEVFGVPLRTLLEN